MGHEEHKKTGKSPVYTITKYLTGNLAIMDSSVFRPKALRPILSNGLLICIMVCSFLHVQKIKKTKI